MHQRRAGLVTLALAMLATVAALAAPGTASAADAAGDRREVLFVANAEGGTVSLLDVATLEVVREIDIVPDGRDPSPAVDPVHAVTRPLAVESQGENVAQDLDVSPDGSTLYVSRGFRGDVSAFSIATGKQLWRVPMTGVRADHSALSRDGRRLFVSDLTSDVVQVIDTTRAVIVGSFRTGVWPHGLELSHDQRLIYNGSIGNLLVPDETEPPHRLTVADAATLQVVRSYEFDQGVRPFVVTHDDGLVYLQLSYYHGFVEFDLGTGRTLRRVDLPISDQARAMPRGDYPNEAAHHGIAMTEDERTLCIAGTVSNYAALVSRPSLRTEAIIPVGDEPAWATVNGNGRYCFISSRGERANTVSVIDIARRREVKRVRVGDHPKDMTIGMLPSGVVAAGRCLANRAPVGRRGVGRIRLGRTRAQLERAAGPAARRTRYAHSWCVKRSRARVTAVFGGRSPAARARLVVTTGPGHRMRRVGRGAAKRRLLRRFPSARRLGGRLYRASRRSRRVFGVQGRTVRFAGVADARLLRSRRALRRYLARAR